MEILGRNLPQSKNVISSGLDSVVVGIQQSTQVQGSAGISSASDSFSFAQIGSFGAPEQFPSVADFGEFPNPEKYFQTQAHGNIAGESGSLQKEFLDVLQDKNFNPNSELAGIAKKDIFDTLSKKTESFAEASQKYRKSGPYIAIPPPPVPRGLPGDDYSRWYQQFFMRREELLKQTPTPAQNDALQTGTKSQQAAFSELQKTTLQSDAGGKILDSDKIAHLILPPKQSVPRPQPAFITGPGGPGAGHSTTTGALHTYKPALKGSAEQTATINSASEKAKASYIPKDPEHLSGDYMRGKVDKDLFDAFTPIPSHVSKDPLLDIAVQGSADQTETIKKASQPILIQGSADQTETIRDASKKGTSDQKASLGGGSIVGLVSKLHWDDLKASELKGSAEQTETINNASEKAKSSYIPKDPEYLQGEPKVSKPEGSSASNADQRGIIIVGGKVPEAGKTDGLNPPPKPSGPHPEPLILSHGGGHSGATAAGYESGIGDRIKQNEVTEEAMAHKHSFTGIEPQYLPGESNQGIPITPGEGSLGTELNKELGEMEPPSLTGSAEQNEAIAEAIEKGKASYTPKDPEYLTGEPTASKQEGGSASNADQRGIIIVGGRSSGTYFETIDDTLAKMNQNPQPETIQLFEQQVGALQDLSTTVQRSIQINQQISFATTGKFRV